MQSYSLFEYYPVSGMTVKAAAEDTRGRVSSVNQLVARLEQDHRQAVAAVSGMLEQSVADAPTEAVTTANRVLQQAEYAAGCLELFGTEIDTYNYHSAAPRSISKLNAAYSAGFADGFGATYRDPGPAATLEERQTATEDYSAAWAAGRNQLLSSLNAEKARLDAALDAAASNVSTMLGQGPTTANLLSLWGAGVLPPYAPVLYPGTQFSGEDLPPAAQEELRQYLLDNPDVLFNPSAALAAVIAGLPTGIRTDIYVEQQMEQLRREGLLIGPNPGGLYEDWIRNTVENGVSVATVLAIARDHDIRPDDFAVLDGLQVTTDPDGKSFFVLDADMSGDEARAAALMTYILNAGTDYEGGDFAPTPYTSAEVQRIIDRQEANAWSYDQDVAFVHENGGTLVATPNGMLMGAGGNWLQDLYSQGGGSTWGDIFMINQDDVDNPEELLNDIITGGFAPNSSSLDLDRLLHHEEIHSQQWAEHGYAGFIAAYADEQFDVEVVWIDIEGDWIPVAVPVPVPLIRDGCGNSFEEGAGLEDGGYAPCG